MKKATITGVIVVMACAVAAQADTIPLPGLGNSFGAFAMGHDPRMVTMDNLCAAAAKTAAYGCAKQVEVIALVNDSLSAGRLARYGWRIVTRIGEVATLYGCAESAPYLAALPGIRYIKMPSRVYPTMDSARKVTNVDQVHKTVPGWTGPRLTGKGVLCGFIDTDFDTRHKAFLDSNGLTRFIALWDQDSVAGFPDGIKKNHQELLADSMFGLGTDGHGTFTASYCTGSDWKSPYYGVAPDVVIAGVKMRDDDAHYIDGLNWLFSEADSLHMPCVVNMSLGSPEGPHDGTSLVDRAIDNVSATPGHIVVGASGNDGSKKEHVALQVGRNQSKGSWITPSGPGIVEGAVQKYSAIDMWGDSGKTFSATFYLYDTATLVSRQLFTIPTTASGSWTINTVYWNDVAAGKIDTIVFNSQHAYTYTERTSPLNNKPHLQSVSHMTVNIPSLYLGVSITVAGTTGGTVHAWNIVQRSFKSFGVANYIDGDTNISVNEVGGTAKRNITVGAYVSKSKYALWGGRMSIYPDDSGYHGLTGYSGRGPTVDGRIKPDITAPGSDVAGAEPRFITSTSSLVYWPDSPAVEGRYAVTGGTSVAAPIVAGIVAMMLQIDPTLTVEQVRTYLQETAINDSATGHILTPNNLWGAGKANALGVVAKMLNIAANKPPAVLQQPAPAYRLVKLSGNRLKFAGSLKGEVAVELFSINGRRIMQQFLGRNSSVVTLAPLSQGVYFARAVEKGKVLCSMKVSILY